MGKKKKSPSAYSKVVFIKKLPVIVKAFFWCLRVQSSVEAAVCITAFIKWLTWQLWCLSLRQAFNSQNHLNSHYRIQILFIKLHCSFMNFNQHSSTCTETHALKIPVLIFNLLKKTPKHKHLSIYSDDWHLKPTALTVQYKHSSTTSSVVSMKVPHWQTPTTFC